MEHGAQLAVLLALAALLGVGGGAPAGSGKHQRKIIIHVPYYIKNHHHTHTVYKYVNKDNKDHHGDAEQAGGEGLAQDGGGGGGGGGGSVEHGGQHADGGGSAEAEGQLGGDDAEFIGHHFHQVDDGEATHDSPLALGLHGEPQPVHHNDHHHHDDHHNEHHHHGDHHGGPPSDFHHHRPNKKRQNSVRDEFPHRDQHGHHKHHGHHGHHDHRDHHGHDHNHSHHDHHGHDGHDHHGHDDNHSHHGHSGDNPHFHSKFVVGANDGELHETGSSESSEQSGHRGFQPLTGHNFISHPRENHQHPGFFHGQHESFSSPSEPQEEEEIGESLSQEEKYEGQPNQENYNTQHPEQRTDESQTRKYQNPSSATDEMTSSNRFQYDKYNTHTSYTRDNSKKQKGKRAGDRSRRQKYEVKEPSQEAPPSRSSHYHQEHSSDYQPSGRRKHNFDWR